MEPLHLIQSVLPPCIQCLSGTLWVRYLSNAEQHAHIFTQCRQSTYRQRKRIWSRIPTGSFDGWQSWIFKGVKNLEPLLKKKPSVGRKQKKCLRVQFETEMGISVVYLKQSLKVIKEESNWFPIRKDFK